MLFDGRFFFRNIDLSCDAGHCFKRHIPFSAFCRVSLWVHAAGLSLQVKSAIFNVRRLSAFPAPADLQNRFTEQFAKSLSAAKRGKEIFPV